MRRLATLRSWLSNILPLVPALMIVCADAARRAARIGSWTWDQRLAYLGTGVESALLWGALFTLAARRRGRIRWLAATTLLILGTLSVGTEQYFFQQYGTYLNLDALQFGASFPASVKGQVTAQIRSVLWAQALPLGLLAALVLVGRRMLPPRAARVRTASVLAPCALAGALILPCSDRTVQAATPDVIWLHSVARFAESFGHFRKPAQPSFRTPAFLPSIAASSRVDRNILLVITESVRYDVVCPFDARACETTPFTAEAAPDRIVLRQMRGNSSTTAIELAVLWSGLPPTDARHAILEAPLLFDYARAAGRDTGFWTGHHPMFANTDAFIRDLPVSRRCTAIDLEPEADIDIGAEDGLVTGRALQDIASLHEPWFGVVQYSNTHFPYRVDEDDAPFQPSTRSNAPGENARFFNTYRNAVHAQDKAIAALVSGLRRTAPGQRTVILFTSDHGESFREHHQMGHTGSIFDEQVHVPAWVDAPSFVLTERERAGLSALRDRPTWHIDIAPTVLDLLGILDAPELAHHTDKMLGVSLLRGEANQAMIPMTNCTELWGCAFRNWGMMQGLIKVEAREWDFGWHCWDLALDPAESQPTSSAACDALSRRSIELYRFLPKDAPVMPEAD